MIIFIILIIGVLIGVGVFLGFAGKKDKNADGLGDPTAGNQPGPR